MRHRNVTILCIFIFAFGVLVFSFVYGPLQRTFASPERTVQVSSAADIDQLWESEGVRGRVAVIFTRRLNAERHGYYSQELKYIELAMRRGIVRAVYYIVPDSIWDDVIIENYSMPMLTPPMPTASGFVMLFEGGRVNVMPLSRFWPDAGEKALVVLEPGIWSSDDLAYIYRIVKSGNLPADLFAIIDSDTLQLRSDISAAE